MKYRVFVTSFEAEPIDFVTWFYRGRASAENLIKESNNDAGLAAHPSARFDTNSIHFQLAMVAYNLNCWLLLMQRDEKETVETLKHTTMATSRLRFLFVAAKIWKHAGRVGVSYSDQYQEQGLMNRLMSRLRAIVSPRVGSRPVVAVALEQGRGHAAVQEGAVHRNLCVRRKLRRAWCLARGCGARRRRN